MNLSKTRFAGILLVGTTLWAVCSSVWAQGWQAVWQDASPADSVATPVDWQQRVLKRPEPKQQQRPEPKQQQRPEPKQQQRPEPKQQPTASTRQRAKFVSNEAPEVIPPGTMQFEPLAHQGVFADDGSRPRGGCADCGRHGDEFAGEFHDCDSCDVLACDDYCDFGYEVFDGRCGRLLRDLSIFAGAHGFKGPLDRGVNGNFGFQEGLNFAGPLGDPWGCGYQVGANFVQSNFSSGQTVTLADQTAFRVPGRNQNFITAAIFRRALCGGFQWGVAYDYLHDGYYETYDLQQIRSELGWVIDDRHEIGYYGAYGTSTAQQQTTDGKLDPIDMFIFYVRRNFGNGGDGRIWGGATSNGDGLVGAELWVPIGRGFALENRFNYLVPNSRITSQRTTSSSERESWGLTIQLVWYLGQNARCQQQNPYRALFNVADNSLFMVDRLAN